MDSDPKYQSAFGFHGGNLTIKRSGYGANNGDGHFAFAEDDLQWEEVDRWISIPQSELRELRNFLNKEFALIDATPATPAETVEVRAAVVMSPDGEQWTVHGWRSGGVTSAHATLIASAYQIPVAIITARVPLPAVPTIAAEVREP